MEFKFVSLGRFDSLEAIILSFEQTVVKEEPEAISSKVKQLTNNQFIHEQSAKR